MNEIAAGTGKFVVPPNCAPLMATNRKSVVDVTPPSIRATRVLGGTSAHSAFQCRGRVSDTFGQVGAVLREDAARRRIARASSRIVVEIIHPPDDHDPVGGTFDGPARDSVAGIEIEGRQIDPVVDQHVPRAGQVALDLIEGEVEGVLVEANRQVGGRRQVDLDELLVLIRWISSPGSVIEAGGIVEHLGDDRMVGFLGNDDTSERTHSQRQRERRALA